MTGTPNITFTKPAIPARGSLMVLLDDTLSLTGIASELDRKLNGAIARSISTAEYKAKAMSTLEILSPGDGKYDRVVVLGLGDAGKLTENDWMRAGGAAMAALPGERQATVLLVRPDGRNIRGREAASFAAGMKLRSYSFDKYKSKPEGKNSDGGKPKPVRICVGGHAAARRAWAVEDAVTGGTILARDLVNEPANTLGPIEFATIAAELSSLGIKVEILTEEHMRGLGMHALLGVGQGSERPSRMAVMSWEGGRKRTKPIAFVGKGVVFDTGGISLKPGAGMGDMKGDMGGAAAVTGLMHAVASRKARANVVGVIGLVENMPDGNAQRPGDVVTSMSGQTIEILNTDAEGRLVLADALHYTIDRFKPQIVVDLATLTGACIVALGHDHAGLFSNDEELTGRLTAAGKATGEKVWPLPLGPEYDKLIKSKVADMKNIGGRWGGAITAAQFLKRFVGETPWAHLDIAGTAMDSPATEYSRSWASGFGVRLLDRLIADCYEG